MLKCLAASVAFMMALMSPTPAQAATYGTPWTDPDTGLTSHYVARASQCSGTQGLVVYLHGDGAWEFSHKDDYSIWTPSGVLAQASAQCWAVVAVKTPLSDLTWWTAPRKAGRYLDNFLTHYRARQSVSRKPVVLAGYSGGSQQITKTFVPRYGTKTFNAGGGLYVFGGGGGTRHGGLAPSTGLPVKAAKWSTGTADKDDEFDGYGEARDGARTYKAKGYTVVTDWRRGADHAYWEGRFGREIARYLRTHLAN